MKKLLMAAAVLVAAQFAIGQSGPKWATGGNSTGPNAFLGTTNNRPLNFKTNGLGRMKLTESGWLGVGTSTPGYLLDVAGTVNAQDYLISGNPLSGAFLPINGGTLTGDLVLASGANLKTASSTAGLSLEAFGFPSCIQLRQELTGTGLQQLKLVPASAAVVVLPNSPDGEIGLVDENPNGTIKLKTGTNANEIRALTINGRVGVGGNQKVIELKNHTGDVLTLDGIAGPTVWDAPQGLTINGDFEIGGGKLEVNRITSDDSLLFIGDSTLILNYAAQSIYGDISGTRKGTAVGFGSIGFGKYSTAIGYLVRTSPLAEQAVVIGSKPFNAQNAVYNVPNSLVVAFNSDVPTMIVTEADGAGTTGDIGMGMSAPLAKLDLRQDDDQETAFRICKQVVKQAPQDIMQVVKLTPTTSEMVFIVKDTGNVGIGTSSPTERLEVIGNQVLSGTMQVGQHAVPNGFKMAVDGKAIFEEVEVQLSSDWPDYVFEPEYALKPWSETVLYYKKNKHLPGVPSQQHVQDDGLSVGEMQVAQMRSIEELYLYMEEMNQRISMLEQENQALRVQLNK